jgi:hypothetical protein
MAGMSRFAALALLATVGCCTHHAQPPAPGSSAVPAATSSAGAASHVAKSNSAPMPTSAEACQMSCRGSWGQHGLSRAVGCLCRTNDAGKDCRQGSECEGQCILKPLRTQVTDPGPPARGYFLGSCSEFVTTFGCLRRLAPDALGAGPVNLSDAPPEICLD